ncbi:hypothetical protein [Thiocapsa marina]|uniref:hypothetical protein n=1 Tax=Thiocapsa marina TaxID=244573 RepID=UPI0002E9BFD5|nr:hypothetical protein [Thiocapsa marina]
MEDAEQGFGAIRAAARQLAEVRTRFRAAAKRCRKLGLDGNQSGVLRRPATSTRWMSE